MKPIIMPQVGQDIPKGKIVQWLKQENDRVEKGEVVLVVESEKATFEIEAEQSGILLKILYPQDEEVEILKPIGYIGRPGETVGEGSADTGRPPAAVPAEAEPPQPPAPLPPARPGPDKPVASPSARRLAREKGIDLALLRGSGPGGRITRDDVLAATGPAAKEAPITAAEPEKQQITGEDTVVPFGKMRAQIARRLTLSKQTIPHYYLLVDVDMTEAQKWRRSFNAEQGTQITVTDLVIKAAAASLREVPRLNAHVDGQRLVIKSQVNIGVAVAVDEGLLVPVIPDADSKGLRAISKLSKKNAESARRGMITAGAVGTFTVSSLGMYRVRQFVPIINPPECAILAVGAVEPRVAPVPGGIGVRQMTTLTLACDHRAVDGADAAGLLDRIKSNLEGIRMVQKQWV